MFNLHQFRTCFQKSCSFFCNLALFRRNLLKMFILQFNLIPSQQRIMGLFSYFHFIFRCFILYLFLFALCFLLWINFVSFLNTMFFLYKEKKLLSGFYSVFSIMFYSYFLCNH